MAQYQNQYSAGQTDESDNLRRTDEYGNPTHNTGIGGTHNTGTTGMCTGDQQQMGQQGLGGKLNRSGSGSSSSDEEDGQGGRRKKGLKERIPGVGHRAQDDQCLGQGQGQGRRPTAAPTTEGLGYGATNTHGVGGTPKPDGYDAATGQEKKGMMEKIKEKLPGGHNK